MNAYRWHNAILVKLYTLCFSNFNTNFANYKKNFLKTIVFFKEFCDNIFGFNYFKTFYSEEYKKITSYELINLVK